MLRGLHASLAQTIVLGLDRVRVARLANRGFEFVSDRRARA
jgi:hypothetical protein